MDITTLSSKGQIVIPKTIRQAHGWHTGVRFVVEDTPQGLWLRPVGASPAQRLSELRGCAGYAGPALTLEQMEAAIADAARQVR